MKDWQALGEAHRQRLGIDGTAGDAQDLEHPYISEGQGFCVVCGLAMRYRKHPPGLYERTDTP